MFFVMVKARYHTTQRILQYALELNPSRLEVHLNNIQSFS